MDGCSYLYIICYYNYIIYIILLDKSYDIVEILDNIHRTYIINVAIYVSTLLEMVMMRMVGVRELKNRLSHFLSEADKEGAVVVTNHGVPCAAIVPLSPDELEDFLIARSPRIRRMIRRGAAEIAEGKTVTLDQLLEEIPE